MRCKTALWVLTAVSLAASSSSYAQPAAVAGQVAKDQGMAMEHYDLGDYPAARKKLGEILAGLSRGNHGATPAAARTHVLMGAVYYKESQSDLATKQYVLALKISDTVTLPKAYSEAGNQALFAKAKLAANPPKASCDTLPGIAHTRVTDAKQGVALKLETRVGNALRAQAVVVMFRIDGQGAFAEQPLKKTGTCTYSGELGAAQVKGRSLSYYVVARNKRGKNIARHANPGNPIVVTVAQSVKAEPVGKTGKPGDDEVPKELQVKKKPRGCGGCGTSPGQGPSGLVVLLAGVWFMRRRRLA